MEPCCKVRKIAPFRDGQGADGTADKPDIPSCRPADACGPLLIRGHCVLLMNKPDQVATEVSSRWPGRQHESGRMIMQNGVRLTVTGMLVLANALGVSGQTT